MGLNHCEVGLNLDTLTPHGAKDVFFLNHNIKKDQFKAVTFSRLLISCQRAHGLNGKLVLS